MALILGGHATSGWILDGSKSADGLRGWVNIWGWCVCTLLSKPRDSMVKLLNYDKDCNELHNLIHFKYL